METHIQLSAFIKLYRHNTIVFCSGVGRHSLDWVGISDTMTQSKWEIRCNSIAEEYRELFQLIDKHSIRQRKAAHEHQTSNSVGRRQ